MMQVKLLSRLFDDGVSQCMKSLQSYRRANRDAEPARCARALSRFGPAIHVGYTPFGLFLGYSRFCSFLGNAMYYALGLFGYNCRPISTSCTLDQFELGKQFVGICRKIAEFRPLIH